MEKKLKKNMTITKKEHDAWHRKNKGYDTKDDKEHARCHKRVGIIIKG